MTRGSTITALLVFMAVMLVSVIAFAAVGDATATATATAPAPTAIGRFMGDIMAILTPTLVGLVGGLAVWVLTKLAKKFHIQISDATASSWADIAEKAALRGAEYVRAKMKDGVAKKIPGPEVLEVAANWAEDVGENLKLPDMARKSLEGLIEAHLFKLRQQDAQATVDTAVALSNATIAVPDVAKMPVPKV